MTTTAPPPVSRLTHSEREVISFMALGYSNAGICAALDIAPTTLETHVQHLFSKLDLPPAPEYHRRVCAVLAWKGDSSVLDFTGELGLTPTQIR